MSSRKEYSDEKQHDVRFIAALLAFFCAAALAPRAEAAIHLPLSDADLTRRAPLIVLAEVVDEEVASLESGGLILPFTHPLKDTEDYALSESALSKFDVLEDEEVRHLSGPDAAGQPVTVAPGARAVPPGFETDPAQAFSGIRHRIRPERSALRGEGLLRSRSTS